MEILEISKRERKSNSARERMKEELLKGREPSLKSTTSIEQINPLIRRLEAERKWADEKADQEWGGDEDMRKVAKARALSQYCKQAHEMLAYAKEKYPNEYWIREDYYPLRSWLGNPKIQAVLRIYPKLTPILNFNDRMSDKSKKDRSQEKEECTTGKGKPEKRYRSYFMTGKDYQHELQKYLIREYRMDISPATITRHLRTCCEAGFYKPKKMRDEHGWVSCIYYDGYWLENPGYPPRKIRYMKYDRRGRKAMENFRIWSSAKEG